MKPEINFEIKTYYHKGISICIEINYDLGLISIIENITKDPKRWLFAKRGVEYMPGWINILEAMTLSIKEAENDLLTYQKRKEKKLLEKHVDFQKAIDNINKPKNK